MPRGDHRSEAAYTLTRDGFSLLVMGFTGAKALEWKRSSATRPRQC